MNDTIPHRWDARRALTALEVGVLSSAERPVRFTRALAEESNPAHNYDGSGDEQYDVANAFIKSLRGSDPDAAIYWLARMLEAKRSLALTPPTHTLPPSRSSGSPLGQGGR